MSVCAVVLLSVHTTQASVNANENVGAEDSEAKK